MRGIFSASGSCFPRRTRCGAVKSTRAPESSSRVAIAPAPNPAKIGTTISPACRQPYSTPRISGTIGITRATRSPASRPSFTSPRATRLASRRNSPKVIVRVSPFSPSHRQAVRPGSDSAQRSRQLYAMFSRPPVNHCDHSGPWLASSTRRYGSNHATRISSSISSQKRSGSWRENSRNASRSANPSRCMKRHTLVPSMNARDGSQIMHYQSSPQCRSIGP